MTCLNLWVLLRDVTCFNPFNFTSGRIRNIRHRHLQIKLTKTVDCFLKLTRKIPHLICLFILLFEIFFWLFSGLKIDLQKTKSCPNLIIGIGQILKKNCLIWYFTFCHRYLWALDFRWYYCFSIGIFVLFRVFAFLKYLGHLLIFQRRLFLGITSLVLWLKSTNYWK